MIGVLIQLAISWLLVWLVEKKNLNVLGFFPIRRRLTDFLLFFFVAAACSASGFILKMIFWDQQWTVNPELSYRLILSGIWYNIKSVLFEELIFRGVLLYILIKRLGASKAMFISAIAFGIYHWFTFGVLGDPLQMLIVFLITAVMGMLYAYGYAKTFSLYVPIAIHFGWNVTQSVFFSNTNIGKQLLVPSQPIIYTDIGFLPSMIIELFPIVTVLFINFLLIRKRKQEATP